MKYEHIIAERSAYMRLTKARVKGWLMPERMIAQAERAELQRRGHVKVSGGLIRLTDAGLAHWEQVKKIKIHIEEYR